MSDAAILKRRSADELRFLKDHIKKIRQDPEVAALAAVHEKSAPCFTIEALQNGVIIGGHPCRLTIGTLALLRASKSRCLGYGEDGKLNDYDIALAVFLLSEECLNLAVSVVGDNDELSSAVKQFSRSLNINAAAVELFEYLRRTFEAIHNYGGKSKTELEDSSSSITDPDDSWATDVDLIAYEYKWNDQYILWKVPLIRIMILKDCIVARRECKPRSSTYSKSGIDLLKAIEKKGEELKNGNE